LTILFDELIEKAKNKGKIKVAVVNPVDDVSFLGAIDAKKAELVDPIMIGSKKEILSLAKKHLVSLDDVEIIDCESEEDVLNNAVELCKTNKVQALMKGKIHTDHIMSAVIKRDNGLRTDKQISHIFALNIPTYHKVLYICDAVVSIAPTLEQKEKILHNAIDFLNNIGMDKPKVGILSAVEHVNAKIISTTDADSLANNESLKARAIIEGPLAFDNVISKEAADIKGIKSKIAGDVDLILAPNLEAGNILFKALVYLARAEVAGVILGARIPVILTSRADNARARLVSSALAVLAV
jgi:phosphate acetyltransferase